MRFLTEEIRDQRNCAKKTAQNPTSIVFVCWIQDGEDSLALEAMCLLGRQSARSGKRSVGTREAKRSGSKSHDRDTKWCAQEAKRFAMRSLERQCARSGRQVSVLGMKSVSAQEANRSGGEAVARKVKRSLVTLTALRLVTNLVSHKSRWSRISSIANLVRQQTRWSLISSFMCHVIQIHHHPKL